jgi:hypothetical protein
VEDLDQGPTVLDGARGRDDGAPSIRDTSTAIALAPVALASGSASEAHSPTGKIALTSSSSQGGAP